MPSEYEEAFKEEIWGCYKYVGIPLETIYNMPIQERKFFIMKHNIDAKREQEAMNSAESGGGGMQNFDGEAINALASQMQQK